MGEVGISTTLHLFFPPAQQTSCHTLDFITSMSLFGILQPFMRVRSFTQKADVILLSFMGEIILQPENANLFYTSHVKDMATSL